VLQTARLQDPTHGYHRPFVSRKWSTRGSELGKVSQAWRSSLIPDGYSHSPQPASAADSRLPLASSSVRHTLHTFDVYRYIRLSAGLQLPAPSGSTSVGQARTRPSYLRVSVGSLCRPNVPICTGSNWSIVYRREKKLHKAVDCHVTPWPGGARTAMPTGESHVVQVIVIIV